MEQKNKLFGQRKFDYVELVKIEGICATKVQLSNVFKRILTGDINELILSLIY